ncbi:hypothetical protein H1R20_g9313, partial [Candolleomyces eurysporus]
MDNEGDSDQVMDVEEANRIRRQIAASSKGKKTTIHRPLEAADHEAFLGYALLDIVVENDGGKGPELVASPYSRSLSTRQLNDLRDVAGKDGRGLRTRDHENAIYVAVPKQTVDVRTLSPSPYGPHNRINWLPGSTNQTMVLLAGAHRQKTAQDLSKERRQEIQKLLGQIERLASKRKERKREELETTVSKLREAIEPQTVWLTILYDKDIIMQNIQHSASGLLKLITNNRLAPAPQTENHELFTVFRMAYESKATQGDALFEVLSTLKSKRGEAYRRMVQRGEDFLAFNIETRASTHFDHFYTDSAQIINIQQSTWGLIGPFIRFMWRQLLYICSEAPIPERFDDITDEYRSQILEVVNGSPASTYVSHVLLDALVALADDAYNEHFSGEFLHVGTKDEGYWNSYNGYCRHVVNGFEEALVESRNTDSKRWTERDEAVAKEAPTKLRLILYKQAAFRAPEALKLDSAPPLFTPMCGAAIIEDWYSLKDTIYLQFSSFFVPCLSSVQHLNISGKPPFSSYPSAIRRFLEYWLGFNSHEKWSAMTPEEMSEELFEDGITGRELVDGVFNIILRLLWRHRETLLRPAQRLLPIMPQIKTSSSKTASSVEDPEFHKQLINEGSIWLRSWLKVMSKKQKLNIADVTPRLDPDLPTPIAEAIDKWELETGETRMRPIFDAFECSITNFLMGPTGPTNNRAHHQNQLRFLADEIDYYENQLIPTLEVVTPVAALYGKLVDIIHGFPQLEHARFWTQVPLSVDGPMVIDETHHTKVLIRKNRTARVDIFNKALTTFINRISKTDCMGLLAEPDCQDEEVDMEKGRDGVTKLHLAFSDEINSMVHKARIVSHHLGVISESSDLTNWPVVEDGWYEVAPVDRRLHLPICGIDDLLIHYQDEDVRAQQEGRRSNALVEEDAVNSQFGILGRSTPKRDRSQDNSEENAGHNPKKRARGEMEGMGERERDDNRSDGE